MSYATDLKEIAEEVARVGGPMGADDNVRELAIGLAEAWDKSVDDVLDALTKAIANSKPETIEAALERHGFKSATRERGGGADWVNPAWKLKAHKGGGGIYVTGNPTDADYVVIDRRIDDEGDSQDDELATGSSAEEIVSKAKRLLK